MERCLCGYSGINVFVVCRSDQTVLINPALILLNAHGAQFDAAQVLELLPHNWPVATVKEFLLRSIRGSMDAHRTSKIEYNLAKGENLQVICTLYEIIVIPNLVK